MSIANRARPEIRRLVPYQAAIQLHDTVRLNANEAPWTSGADRYRRPLNRYPEIRPAGLQTALAKRFGCKSKNLLVTRGTSEAIDLLIRIFCRAGRDNIVTTTPTFSMYRHYAFIQGAEVREVQTDAELNFCVFADDVVRICDQSTRVVFLCSPNNPTGTSIPLETIAAIVERLSGQSAVVIDEAYIEFSQQDTAATLLDRFDNLIILRTLSKALAFAGARCGAVIGPPDVINMLDAIQAPYAFATPVVECVENALQDKWLVEAERRVQELINERERIRIALSHLPFVRRQWDSAANFILIKLDDASGLMSFAQDHGVLLRSFGDTLTNCVRITVGSPAENDALLRLLTLFESDRG